MTILIDLDDTMWNLGEAWIEALNQTVKVPRKIEDINEWDIEKFYPELTREQVYAPLLTNELWESVQPATGAREFTERLVKAGHNVKVVTATHLNTIQPKMRRFFELFPHFKCEDVVIAHDKSVVLGDVLVDDGIHNIVATPCPFKILYDRPHNRAFDVSDTPEIMRAESWEDVMAGISIVGLYPWTYMNIKS